MNDTKDDSKWNRFLATCSKEERMLIDQIAFIRKNVPNLLEIVHSEDQPQPTEGKIGLYKSIVAEIDSMKENFCRILIKYMPYMETSEQK